jgi:DNA-binding IclR family transcriptional regulator
VTEDSLNLVPAVDRAIQILHSFHSGDESYGVSDLSRMLELNKSTVYDILNTLTYHGFLEREEESRKYRLGPALFHLGNLVGARLTVRDVAHPFVRELASTFTATVILASFTPNQRVMIVDSAEPELNVKITASIGSRISHWSGVFGKIFHAAMGPQEFQALLDAKPMVPLTENSISNSGQYINELDMVRAQGYALDNEEYLDGVRAVGVPINDREGRVAAALIVMGFCRMMDETKIERLVEELPRAGRRISELLGAREYPQWNGTWAE